MIVFRLARPVMLERQRLRQRLVPPAAPEGRADGLFVTTPDDLGEIVGALAPGLRHAVEQISENAVTTLPAAPPLLGRGPGHPARETSGTPGSGIEREPGEEAGASDGNGPGLLLSEQASDLPRARAPRLAIINGFGTGIGDTLVGMTAWRHALAALGSAGVPAPDAALWVRPRAIRNAMAVCAHSPGIARCQVLPAPADAFLDLDGYWDLSGLAGRPGFHELPLVDLLLSLLGLDPASIPPEAKRNRLDLEPVTAGELDALLAREAPEYLLIHPLSSNPIRNMPAPVALGLVRLLHRRTGLPVVTTIGGLPSCPGLLDLSAHARGFDRLCVFVARARGLVTVDTSTYHIADAFDVPSVVAFTTVDPALRLPYYPRARGVSLPGMRESGAWGIQATRDEGLIRAVQERWQGADLEAMVDTLVALMGDRGSGGEDE